ncbi:hypothetical protein Bca4012_020633 [Brassica carinata]
MVVVSASTVLVLASTMVVEHDGEAEEALSWWSRCQIRSLSAMEIEESGLAWLY